MPNTYDLLAPAPGDVANSYELLTDINTGTDAAPVWLNVPEISGLDPAFSDVIKELSNYAYKGVPGKTKSGETFVLTFNVTKRRVPGTHQFYPWYTALTAKAAQKGEANKIGVRFYDALGADEAFQAKALVSHPKRNNTGDNDTDIAQFTLTGDGTALPIANPLAGALVPLLSGASPSGAAAGTQVAVYGSRFTGTSAVKFGAVAATSYVIVNDNYIVAIVPTGAAGSAPITVTNGAGVSTALAYTRGA